MNMGSTIKTTLASAALIFAASCSQAVSEPAGKVSTTDKAAIEKIVHEYLVANPEVLVEAFQALEAKQELAEAEQKSNSCPLSLHWKTRRSLVIKTRQSPLWNFLITIADSVKNQRIG